MFLMSRVRNPGRPMGHGIEMSRPTKEAQEVHPVAAPLGGGPARALASGIAAYHARENATGITPHRAVVVRLALYQAPVLLQSSDHPQRGHASCSWLPSSSV